MVSLVWARSQPLTVDLDQPTSGLGVEHTQLNIHIAKLHYSGGSIGQCGNYYKFNQVYYKYAPITYIDLYFLPN